ncbi:YncE family protein, partial [Tsukamurella ocularis]|uniref:YncE family protein n=1 Tax=Tsukamurella ocularis TaxID=1970234 RepID=UPI0039F11353
AVPPAGAVAPAAAGEGLAFDAKSRRLAALAGREVVLYTVDGGLKEVARIDAGARAHQVVPSYGEQPYGDFLVATDNGVMTITGDAGSTQRIEGGALTVSLYGGESGDAEKVWGIAGTPAGEMKLLRVSDQPRTITGPVEASRVLTDGSDVVVVDRLQSSITQVDVAGGKIGKGLRVGRGVTNATITPDGRVFAVDTGKNQVIGYTAAPLMERFLYPEKGSPWAVDYDETDKLMWVTRTATNEVVGYALNSGIPEQRKLYPTVRQPNAIAVDAKTGTLYVQSATGAGIQAIPTR